MPWSRIWAGGFGLEVAVHGLGGFAGARAIFGAGDSSKFKNHVVVVIGINLGEVGRHGKQEHNFLLAVGGRDSLLPFSRDGDSC